MDEYELTALHHACFNGFEDTAETLLQLGSDANAHSEVYGTPLCLAAIRGRLNVLDILLKARANLQAPGGLLGSPMHSACFCGSVPIIEKLVALRSTIDHDRLFCYRVMSRAFNGFLTPKTEGQWLSKGQPLHTAMGQRGNNSTIKYILLKGADVDVRYANWKGLRDHDAVHKNTTGRYLIEGGPALMIAAANGHIPGSGYCWTLEQIKNCKIANAILPFMLQ